MSEITIPALIAAVISSVISLSVKARFARKLEEAKKDLLIEAKRDEIRFSELRKQQANVLEKLYEKLSSTYKHATKVVVPNVSEEEIRGTFQRFSDVKNDFNDYFEEHRIFMPARTCEHIERFLDEIDDILRPFLMTQHHTSTPAIRWSGWEDARGKITDGCKKIKVEIELQFRGILGV